MERIIRLEPAWDKRSDDPNKNYGIHGVTLGMYLKGDRGTIQFIVYTNWYLEHVMKSMKHSNFNYNDGLFCPFKPLPADVGYHSAVPLYENQNSTTDHCEWTGGKCYYDGSGLQAEDVFKILTEQGSEGVWKELEERYYVTFGK
jgi:hypothetical protein